MIRKKRSTTQVEMFEAPIVIADPREKKTGQEFPKVTFARDFQLPIPLDEQKSDETPSTGEIVRMLTVPKDIVPSEPEIVQEQSLIDEAIHESPEVSPRTDDEASEISDFKPAGSPKEPTDRIIVNRDFADGFHLTQEQLRTEYEHLKIKEKRLSEALKRQRAIKLAAIALLSFAVLLLWNWQEWVVNSSLFTLKSVHVQGHRIADRETILRDANPEMGLRLAEVDLKKIADRVAKNPMFKTVAVSRSYPSSITIHVTERQPTAFVLLDRLHAVDEHGVVLPQLSTKMVYNLPVISGVPTIAAPGKTIQVRQMTTALRVLDVFRQIEESLYYEVSEIHFSKESTRIYLNNMRTTFLLDDSNLERTAAYLTAVIQHLKQNELTRKYKSIDLRFEGQIIAKY